MGGDPAHARSLVAARHSNFRSRRHPPGFRREFSSRVASPRRNYCHASPARQPCHARLPANASRISSPTSFPFRLTLCLLLAGPWSGGAVVAADNPAAAPSALNRLAAEKSPYLRQHASNPVDWFPWGEEAFARARRENKPIFLSIGYSTCHWCHVMARESFSDPEIARYLNEHFVSIKVDREERPDVDRVYLAFVQASTGGGGWPMSVWLTPDLKPFFGGTYFAPDDRPGRPGFKTLLHRLVDLWERQHAQVLEQSDQMLSALAADTRPAAAATEAFPVAAWRDRAFQQLDASFDQTHGGFESAPKFPTVAPLTLLFDEAALSADPARRQRARAMALDTLRAIARGGIRDQLGGGFHRYAVDAAWRVPHFEKMLYDQAQLAGACLTAAQLADDPLFREAAVDTLRYVEDQLTDPAGGFYTAEDADSVRAGSGGSHAEGAFYVWTADELTRLAGTNAALFAFVYGVEARGNVREDPSGELAGQNVLYLAHTIDEAAAKFHLSPAEVRTRLTAATAALSNARAQRPRPLRDDKIVTAWNGLALSAFARATQVLGDPHWAATATRAATFLQTNLYDAKTHRLARSYRGGTRDPRGFAEDYAFLVQGLLDLYETTFDHRWLEWAVQLQETQNERFLDAASGGYFADAGDDPSVLLRLKEDNDGPEPSANSVAVRNLARLGAMLHRDDWLALARRNARAFSAALERAPLALPQLLAAAGGLDGSSQQILIHGDRDDPTTRRLVAEVWSRYLPRRALAVVDDRSRAFFNTRVPLIADFPADTPRPAIAYLCENFVCQLPTPDPAVLARLLPPPATSHR